MNWTDKIQVYNEDCMQTMSRYADNHFDLAIVDPEYGINVANMGLGKGKGTNSREWIAKDWDNKIPNAEYFKELFRVSKNQIIWGGNYFIDYLKNTRCFLMWDKIQEFSGSDFELAWTSFDKPSKSFRMARCEAYVGINKIHPTQKPVALYNWILDRYAKPDFKILDTHLGSGSHAISCHYFGCELVAAELDTDYYNDSFKRFKLNIAQKKLF